MLHLCQKSAYIVSACTVNFEWQQFYIYTRRTYYTRLVKRESERTKNGVKSQKSKSHTGTKCESIFRSTLSAFGHINSYLFYWLEFHSHQCCELSVDFISTFSSFHFTVHLNGLSSLPLKNSQHMHTVGWCVRTLHSHWHDCFKFVPDNFWIIISFCKRYRKSVSN